MNFSELSPPLFNDSSAADDGSLLTLKVIYNKRKQALLVPLDTKQAHQAINFFINNRLLKAWGHFLIEFDRHISWLHLLPIAQFNHFPLKTLFGVKNVTHSKELAGIAIFIGSPGPLQKLTIYCPNPFGGLGKVAKVAIYFTANEVIKKESYWLEKLSHSNATAKYLPKLIQHSALICQRRYLTMMSLPNGNTSKNFSTAHHAFLRALAQQNPIFTQWDESEVHMRLKKRIHHLSAVVDEDIWLFWEEIITQIEYLIAQTVLPNLMVHGDFAPWNLRLVNADLYVFDWEYAQTHGNPLQDFIHFHLIPQALIRKSLNNKAMSNLLEKTVTYVDNQFGQDLGVSKACGALTLHYLLDTITFYAEASGYFDDNHPVLHSYTQMLKQRQQWLPKIAALPIIKSRESHSYANEWEITQ